MNAEQNLRNLTDEEKELILDAFKGVYGKYMPNSKKLDYLYEEFKRLVDPTFEPKCSRCKRRVIDFWKMKLESWKIL